MYWYTDELGQLCVGSQNKNRGFNLEIKTNLVATQPIHEPISEEQIYSIGAYPEDWRHDSDILRKLTVAAMTFFPEQVTCEPSKSAEMIIRQRHSFIH